MIAATTDFITITDFVPAINNPNYYPVDNNGVVYKCDWKNMDDDNTDQLYFVRSINCVDIPTCAFAYCDNLRIVLMDDSVREIDRGAFSCCTSLQHVKLSRNIQDIREDAFRKCTSLSSMFIPDSCQNIEMHAFVECINLTILVIPHHTDIRFIVPECSKFLQYSPYGEEDLWPRSLANKWIKECFQHLPFHQFCCSTNISSLAMYKY